MDEPYEALVDVVLFKFGKGLFVKSFAVGAFEVGEFHNGDWRCLTPQGGFAKDADRCYGGLFSRLFGGF